MPSVLSAGEIVGIVCAVVLGVVIAVGLGLIIYIVLGRMRVKSLPPAARRGSVRLSKNKIIFNSAAGDNVCEKYSSFSFEGCLRKDAQHDTHTQACTPGSFDTRTMIFFSKVTFLNEGSTLMKVLLEIHVCVCILGSKCCRDYKGKELFHFLRIVNFVT